MIVHQTTNSYGNYNYNAFVYKNIGWDPHFHGNYELIYSMEGVTVITVNGTDHSVSAGEFLLIAPYSVHHMQIKGEAKVWIGVFSEDHVYEFAKGNSGTGFSVFRCDGEVEEFLKKYLLYQGDPDRYMCIACLNAVCDQCLKHASRLCEESDVALSGKIIEYISSRVGEKIDMQSVAEALGYEYHYFSGLFNKIFSMNFKSFINMFRFERACKLLEDSSKSISYISFECGFETVRNFNRVFKELGGMTPREYRQRL